MSRALRITGWEKPLASQGNHTLGKPEAPQVHIVGSAKSRRLGEWENRDIPKSELLTSQLTGSAMDNVVDMITFTHAGEAKENPMEMMAVCKKERDAVYLA